MRMRTVLMTAQAFVGLVVGAGFATGQEVIQYFISFGAIGIPTWMGAGLMTLRVLAVGQLDVDRVSNIISLVTQLIVVTAAVLLCLRIPGVTGSDVPMLKTFESIHPAAASVMVEIIFLMIFNTAIASAPC